MKGIKRALSVLFLVWCFGIFIAAMFLVMPFIFLVLALFKDKRGSDIIFFFLKVWAWIFCILCAFQVKTRNKLAVKPKKAYVYVCNHSSYLDAIAVVLAIPGSFKPLGKIETVKVPVFGLIYRKVVVLIDRASKESRARSVEELKAGLAKGQSVLVFPEGTMNQSNKALTDFYDGAFRLAIETGTPIVPMVIVNARNLLPRANPSAARPGRITCVFEEPITVKGLVPDDLESLKSLVYKTMEASIERHS